jgi:hypothetical protein
MPYIWYTILCDIFGRILTSVILRPFAVLCVAGVPSLRPFACLTSFRDFLVHSQPASGIYSESACGVMGVDVLKLGQWDWLACVRRDLDGAAPLHPLSFMSTAVKGSSALLS